MSMPPPPAQPPGYHYPYPPPPKKRVIWPWILIGGLIVMCGGCAGLVSLAGMDKDDAVPAPTRSGSVAVSAVQPAGPVAEQEPVPAAIGTEVRDGKFAFVVNNVETGRRSVGTNPYLRKEAQGTYVLVHTTVTNIGTKPQTYFGQNQKLVDAQGRQFANDYMAEVNVNDSAVMANEINPGNQMAVTIVFDVPADAVPDHIILHDSAFSGGVQASLK